MKSAAIKLVKIKKKQKNKKLEQSFVKIVTNTHEKKLTSCLKK